MKTFVAVSLVLLMALAIVPLSARSMKGLATRGYDPEGPREEVLPKTFAARSYDPEGPREEVMPKTFAARSYDPEGPREEVLPKTFA
jgi:hypothetical protein